MAHLHPHDITMMFLSLGILLALARLLGELVHRLGQPAVVGELLAGILLGPTVLGRIAPQATAALFPQEGSVAIVLQGLTTLAIALFLLVAGMEVELSTMWRHGRTASAVAFAGFIVPFTLALIAAYAAPFELGCELDANPRIFALFFATAISISALPVIAKILMDLKLYRSELGMIVIAAAVFNDLVGWIVFAVTLGLLGAAGTAETPVGPTILFTLLFTLAMLTVGRWLINRLLPSACCLGCRPTPPGRAACWALRSRWRCWGRRSPNGSASTPSSARFWWAWPSAIRRICASKRATPSWTSCRSSSLRCSSPASGCTSTLWTSSEWASWHPCCSLPAWEKSWDAELRPD
jgi:hypothetical protein